MKISFFILTFIFSSCAYTNVDSDSINLHSSGPKDTFIAKNSFESVKNRYDTLIPIMNGLFITCDSFDSEAYEKLNPNDLSEQIKKDSTSLAESLYRDVTHSGFDLMARRCKKWGVIDSSNHIIVPFICDAVRELENGEGVFSVYKNSYSLNTGLPRYHYNGYCYFFNLGGILKESKKLFGITTIFLGDFHDERFVIENGNSFFFPNKYYVHHKKQRGAAIDAN